MNRCSDDSSRGRESAGRALNPAEHNPTFTVFTATHNRANLLHRVFESLERQTDQDFEWLIVDDGSTDGTESIVRDWAARATFPVRYVRQPHSGKHVAFNRGVREARGHLFLTWDSDDGAVPEALERFRAHWDAIPADRRSGFSAVTALRRYDDGTPIGDPFPNDITDSDSLDLYFRFRVRGDKWGFHLTDVLRQFPFPEPEGLTFVAESIVWFAIARRYRTRFVNEYLGINYPVAAGETHLSTLTAATARGRLVFHQAVIEDYLDFARIAPFLILKSLVNYSRYSFIAGIGLSGQLNRIRTIRRKVLVLSVAPVGLVFFVRDRLLPLVARRFAS
jgi:glycosyltransferase involved in cell wall biosynthesis